MAMVGIAGGVVVANGGAHRIGGVVDAALLVVGLLLLAWLISSRNSPAHDEPGKSFALRLGQACKRALRRLKGRGVSA